MWRSNVEVEGYSVAYFDRIVVVKLPLRAGLGNAPVPPDFTCLFFRHYAAFFSLPIFSKFMQAE